MTYCPCDFCPILTRISEKNCEIVKVRSDHGGEFENKDFENIFDSNGRSHDFSCPRTPQQNGVVERKNRTLQEMARTMIQETDMAKHFWAEAVNTACYIQNRISVIPILNKTPCELWKNKKPNISYFHPFGCTCFVLNTKDHLGKFDSKAQKCIFLGYSERSKGYRIYNKESQIVEESIHVRFDDKLESDKSKLVEKFGDLKITAHDSEPLDHAPEDEEPAEDSTEAVASEPDSRKGSRVRASHSEDLILGSKDAPVRTRSAFRTSEVNPLSLVSLIEPTSVDEALLDKDWILAMK